jgi:hypothetical protein
MDLVDFIVVGNCLGILEDENMRDAKINWLEVVC